MEEGKEGKEMKEEVITTRNTGEGMGGDKIGGNNCREYRGRKGKR